jgi:hypothetical protein
VNYSAYGLVFSSSLVLPELSRANAGAPALRIRTMARRPDERAWRWLQGRPKRRRGTWVAIGTQQGTYRLVFDGGADFTVSPASRTVAIRTGAAPAGTVRHRLVDQVIPMVMSHFGRIVLHGSALSLPDGAVAFVGPAGAGKSTLAASFALAGTAVLSDDAVFVERSRGRWLAVPAYPGVRLVTGAGGKRRLTPAHGIRFEERRRTLRRVYLLENSTRAGVRPRVERLAPRDAIMTLVEYAFVLDTSDRHRMAAHFSRVAEAAEGLDVRKLVYPRKMSALVDVREIVRADVAAE